MEQNRECSDWPTQVCPADFWHTYKSNGGNIPRKKMDKASESFALWKMLLQGWKDKLQTERRYLSNTYPTDDWLSRIYK